MEEAANHAREGDLAFFQAMDVDKLARLCARKARPAVVPRQCAPPQRVWQR
jgi:hypothetical protein